jgi:hypothetical protein
MTRLIVVITFAMLAFAGNSLLCRIALRDTTIDAATFTSIRLVSGALILAVILRAKGARPMAAGSWRAAFCLFAYAAAFSFAYRQLTAATGALLLFGAVQTAMLSWGLATGERLRQLAGRGPADRGRRPGLHAAAGLERAADRGGRLHIAAGGRLGGLLQLGRGTRIRPTPPPEISCARCLSRRRSACDGRGYQQPDHTVALYAVASGAITSGLGYVLWYAPASLTSASRR